MVPGLVTVRLELPGRVTHALVVLCGKLTAKAGITDTKLAGQTLDAQLCGAFV